MAHLITQRQRLQHADDVQFITDFQEASVERVHRIALLVHRAQLLVDARAGLILQGKNQAARVARVADVADGIADGIDAGGGLKGLKGLKGSTAAMMQVAQWMIDVGQRTSIQAILTLECSITLQSRVVQFEDHGSVLKERVKNGDIFEEGELPSRFELLLQMTSIAYRSEKTIEKELLITEMVTKMVTERTSKEEPPVVLNNRFRFIPRHVVPNSLKHEQHDAEDPEVLEDPEDDAEDPEVPEVPEDPEDDAEDPEVPEDPEDDAEDPEDDAEYEVDDDDAEYEVDDAEDPEVSEDDYAHPHPEDQEDQKMKTWKIILMHLQGKTKGKTQGKTQGKTKDNTLLKIEDIPKEHDSFHVPLAKRARVGEA
jgi:hypothetical protein